MTGDELRDIDRRIQRAGAANCWTGTLGSLAADARRLVRHIEERGMSCEYPVDHILRGERELRHYTGDEMAPSDAMILTEDDAADVAEETARAAQIGDGRVFPEPETARIEVPEGWVVSQAEPWKSYRPLSQCDAPPLHPVFDNPPAGRPVGTTAKFGTGAVRSDTVEAFRYDLVSPIGLREVARACAEGAEKYGDWNWEKGMPVHDLLNHAIAHIYEFLSGDRGEPHLGHAAWNLLAAIHSHELWKHLNDGTLRSAGCTPPSAPPPPVTGHR